MKSKSRIKPLAQYKYLIFLNTLFITIFITCDITAFRMVPYFGHEIPLSGLMIPLVFSIGDIIAEVYGYNVTMQVLKSGIICQFLFGLLITAALKFVPSPLGNVLNQHYNFTFQHIIRTIITSCFSVTSGMMVNAFLISKLKIRMNGKRFWVRTLISSGFSEIVLCSVAYLFLFTGLKNLPSILTIITLVWSYKMVISVLLTPVTTMVGRLVKYLEMSDVYDYGVNYNPFKRMNDSKIEINIISSPKNSFYYNDKKFVRSL